MALPPTTFATPLVPNGTFASSILGAFFQKPVIPPRRPDRNPPPVAPPARPKPAKVIPRPHNNAEWQNTLNQRQVRIAKLKTTRPQELTLVSGQRTHLPIQPVDNQDNPLDGLQPTFTTSDNKVALVYQDELIAGKPGRAEITARVGTHTLQFQVTVLKAVRTLQRPEGTQNNKIGLNRGATQPLRRSATLAGPNSVKAAWRPSEKQEPLKASVTRSRASRASVLLNNPPEDYATVNPYATGAPPHRTEAGANNPPAAVSGTEHPGSANFTFGIPLVNLEGRALDVALGLTYNSLVWKKNGSNFFYFDDESWLASGFGLGYGSLSVYDSSGYLFPNYLFESDGTYRAFTSKNTGSFGFLQRTTDGSFIKFEDYAPGVTGRVPSANLCAAIYPDGTRVDYGSGIQIGSTQNFPLGGYEKLFKLWPVRVTDRNGNYININYVNGVGSKIAFIEDTLGRTVNFHYDSNTGQLVTITVPEYDGGTGRLQVARFYYEALTINPSFTGGGAENPGTRQMLKYIYLNGTQTGWQFDYSTYGMIYRTQQLRGMTVSGQDLTVSGTVTGTGQVAATTEYNYPATPSSLSDVPKYTQRTDTWAGQTTAPMVYQFAVDTANDKTSITAPDGTITETTKYTYSNCSTGCIPGFIKQVTVKQGAATLATTLYEYEQPTGANGDDRIKKITVTNEAGKVRVTEFEIYDSFNNVKKLVERGYDGNIIRRVETAYETGAGWLNRWLLRLPTTVSLYDHRGVQSAYTLYYHDNKDTGVNGQLLVQRSNVNGQDDVLHHNPAYDPYALPVFIGYGPDPNDPECQIGPYEPGCDWIPLYENPYDPATAYRGNLTKIDRYPVPTSPTDLNSTKFKYDIAGNTTEESASCCKQREYTFIKANEYAWPTQIKRGNTGQLTTQINYDRNTSLVRLTTDENNQSTSYDYHPSALRLLSVVRPDGGETTYDYQDGLFNDPDAAHQHSFVTTKVWREGGIYTERTQFFDGRGNLARSLGHYYYDWGSGQTYWSVTDNEYDLMGRPSAVSNPYYGTASDPRLIPRNPSNQWTVYAYDDLGRTIGVQSPDGTVSSIDYTTASNAPGMVETVTDQAGKQRRRILDALGRVTELHEPNSSGSLGTVTSPTQKTTYEYDGLNNVIKLVQGVGVQTRYFKYDGLGRLTHERHVEQAAPHTESDALLTGNSNWSKKIVYNTDGLATDVWDARNIQTHFTYDGLNRVKEATYTGGTVTTPKVTYNYDQAGSGYYNNGRLTEVLTDAVGATVPLTKQKYDYDRMGRVQRQQQTVGTVTSTINYAYNLAGQLATLTYPSGRAVQNQYEAGDGLDYVYDLNYIYVGDIRYTAHGALQQQYAGNGYLQQRTYNNRLQVNKIELLDWNSASVQRYEYLYGKTTMSNGAVDATKNNGQLARVEGFINNAKKFQTRYEYDALGRLQRAAEHRGDNSNLVWRDHYEYDRYGNRWQSSYENTGRPYVETYQTDYDPATNRLVEPWWQHDAAGNLTEDQIFGYQSHVYDAKSRNVSVTSLATQQVVSSAVYDGLGQRVQTTEGSITRRQVYDASGMVLAEYENGYLKRECIYGNGELLSTVEPGNGVRHQLNDQQGSARVVMDDNGLIKARHDYYPFGEEIGYVGTRLGSQGYGQTDGNRKRYAGMEKDGPTGQDHTWFRKADTRSGRWTSPDPYDGSLSVSNPQSTNRYAYVENDPVNLIDPTGLLCRAFTYTWSGWVDGLYGSEDPTYVERTEVVWVCDGNFGGGGGGGQAMSGGGGGVTLPPSGQNAKDIAKCFGKGLLYGAAGALAVGALALGAVALGAPVAAVTLGLGLAAAAGGVFLFGDTAAQITNRNFAGVAYNVGSVIGGLATGIGGGSKIANAIKPGATGGWSYASHVAQKYDSSKGSFLVDFMGTGPTIASGGVATGVAGAGAGVSANRGGVAATIAGASGNKGC